MHSLLKCGECKAKEGPKLPTVAELEAKIAEFKSQQEARKRDIIPSVAQSATPPPAQSVEPAQLLRLDLGCGPNKKPGHVGVDCIEFPGVDHVLNIGKQPWPWKDSTVDEAWSSHTVEHLKFTPEEPERIHFVNELWRVLKPGAKATIVVPHWASSRFWGDYTHRQPVSEFWPPYLDKDWRKNNAPHCSLYTCDFQCTQPGYSLHPGLEFRNAGFRELALTFGKEAAQDMTFTLVCRK